MAEKKTYSLNPETIKKIEKLSEMTHRNQSNVIDWIVEDAFDRILQVQRQTETVEHAINNPQ